MFNVNLTKKKLQGIIGILLFMLSSMIVYAENIHNAMVSFVLGVLACISVILLLVDSERKFGRNIDFFAKYTMPIFLMHTMFAASMRSVLLKIGIENAVIHVVLGLGISFVGPISAAWIMKKIKWLEFFLYPNKFIRTRK